MRTLLVDTAYWVARSNRHDQWHQKAKTLSLHLGNARLLTTELVLAEYLNYFSAYGADIRGQIAATVQDILSASEVQIIWQTQMLFDEGLALYKARLDKGYSLTDCVSMVVMRQSDIREALTHDKHFTQEGFTILL
jgi:uncharacterized protein